MGKAWQLAEWVSIVDPVCSSWGARRESIGQMGAGTIGVAVWSNAEESVQRNQTLSPAKTLTPGDGLIQVTVGSGSRPLQGATLTHPGCALPSRESG